MHKVIIIGCGIVGALLAYELSQVPGLAVTVLDRQPPAQAATGAALGVLMGIISHKIKGKAWELRQTSIQRYETLIPELEMVTGRQIPCNRQGILRLCFAGEDLADWEKRVEIRQAQGWQLEIWHPAQVGANCPQLVIDNITAAIYSPQDRQVDPVHLTLALVEAASANGVTFQFGVTVTGMTAIQPPAAALSVCQQLQTTAGELGADWFVVAAGLGSAQLTKDFTHSSSPSIDIRPVLGQALHLQLEYPLGSSEFQPVITGNDVHIVPIGEGNYWVGATVELPTSSGGEVVPDATSLEAVRQQAVAFCPDLAEAQVIRTWSGLRPRPEGRAAPIIGNLPGYSNIFLATGHYRNGILLAPATAQVIRQMILDFR